MQDWRQEARQDGGTDEIEKTVRESIVKIIQEIKASRPATSDELTIIGQRHSVARIPGRGY